MVSPNRVFFWHYKRRGANAGERKRQRGTRYCQHTLFFPKKIAQNDVNFPLHGDEMKTQEMESFAADKSKEAEAKAN